MHASKIVWRASAWEHTRRLDAGSFLPDLFLVSSPRLLGWSCPREGALVPAPSLYNGPCH